MLSYFAGKQRMLTKPRMSTEELILLSFACQLNVKIPIFLMKINVQLDCFLMKRDEAQRKSLIEFPHDGTSVTIVG